MRAKHLKRFIFKKMKNENELKKEVYFDERNKKP